MSARQRSLVRQIVPPILAALLILACTRVLDPRPMPDDPSSTRVGRTP